MMENSSYILNNDTGGEQHSSVSVSETTPQYKDDNDDMEFYGSESQPLNVTMTTSSIGEDEAMSLGVGHASLGNSLEFQMGPRGCFWGSECENVNEMPPFSPLPSLELQEESCVTNFLPYCSLASSSTAACKDEYDSMDMKREHLQPRMSNLQPKSSSLSDEMADALLSLKHTVICPDQLSHPGLTSAADVVGDLSVYYQNILNSPASHPTMVTCSHITNVSSKDVATDYLENSNDEMLYTAAAYVNAFTETCPLASNNNNSTNFVASWSNHHQPVVIPPSAATAGYLQSANCDVHQIPESHLQWTTFSPNLSPNHEGNIFETLSPPNCHHLISGEVKAESSFSTRKTSSSPPLLTKMDDGFDTGKPNLCRICGKTYARPSTLKTHLRTHSGEKPYKCEDCHKSFSQAANLTAHVRTHSGEKPFRCPICDRRFSQSSSVTTHLRTHSGERPYRCRCCKKAFSDSSTLTKHLRIHSGEKPYQCKLCLLRFSQSGNLNRHMRVHGGSVENTLVINNY